MNRLKGKECFSSNLNIVSFSKEVRRNGGGSRRYELPALYITPIIGFGISKYTFMKPFKKAINQDNVSVMQVKVRVSVRGPLPSLSLNQPT